MGGIYWGGGGALVLSLHQMPFTLSCSHPQDFHGWDGHRFLSSGMDNMVKVWTRRVCVGGERQGGQAPGNGQHGQGVDETCVGGREPAPSLMDDAPPPSSGLVAGGALAGSGAVAHLG